MSTSASWPGWVDVLQHVLELVEVADRLEHARHLPELHRVVAAEVQLLVPGHVGERLLEVPRQLVDLPAEVHVLEQRLREPLELRALLGRHRVEHLLHRGHRPRHLLEQLVEGLGVAGEEVAVALHEAVEVGLLAALTLLEHLVELGEHVLHPRHLLGRDVLHALGHLVEVALHELAAQLVHQLLEPLARASSSMKSYSWSACTLPARSGGSSSSSMLRSAREILDDLLAPLVARLRGPRRVSRSIPARSWSTMSFELLGDVVVDAAEVAVLELLPPALAQPLEHLAHAHQLLAVAVLEALLEHPAQRGVEVAVVEQVVGHLRRAARRRRGRTRPACRPTREYRNAGPSGGIDGYACRRG